MNLSAAQLLTLKAHLAANTNTVQIGGVPVAIKDVSQTPDNAFAVAAWYALPAAPSFNIWRTSVQVAEVMLNGFDWTRVDNLTAGEARIWEWMTSANPSKTFDPSKPNIRAGINETFKGTAADDAVRLVVYSHCYRAVNSVERLFVSGTGAVPDKDGVGPGSSAVEGTPNYLDILNAWAQV